MPLSGAQLALTAEITRESYTSVQALVLPLTTDQQSLLTDDLDTWEAIRDSHVKLQGGSDGVDFDNARKRAAIFYRIRYMLGLPFIVYSLDASSLEFQLFELDVGHGFG